MSYYFSLTEVGRQIMRLRVYEGEGGGDSGHTNALRQVKRNEEYFTSHRNAKTREEESVQFRVCQMATQLIQLNFHGLYFSHDLAGYVHRQTENSQLGSYHKTCRSPRSRQGSRRSRGYFQMF